MKKSFTELARPLIVSSLRQLDEKAVLDDIRKSEADGAKAFILHIELLEEKYKNYAVFKRIADATKHPIMALNYRTESGPDDAHRIKVLIEAVRAGFCAVDIPMNTYDTDPQSSLVFSDLSFVSTNPMEVSMRPEAVEKQKALVKMFKEMGAEVLMSAHVRVDLSVEQALALALEIQSRGADIVKMVSSCKNKAQQLEILRTNLVLQDALDVPFLYTCSGGKFTRFIRFGAPLFGTMLIFGHHAYNNYSETQKPLLKDITNFYSIINKGGQL